MAQRLSDIAKQVGVSQATISRVLNNKPGVSEQTRGRVLRKMEALGISQPLPRKDGQIRLVGLVTPDLSNPIFPSYVTAIGGLLSQRGMLPVLCSYTIAGPLETDYLNQLAGLPLAGAIFLSGNYDNARSDHSVYSTLVQRGVPMAFLNDCAHDLPGIYAGTDDNEATLISLKHLTDLRHRDIGLLLGDKFHYPTRTKYQAAMQFFRSNGISHPDELTQWTTYGITSGQTAAEKLLRAGATAVLCANDQLAIGAIKAAWSLGLSVPEDVSVVGYDDSATMTDLRPALTTVRQPVRLLSAALVNGLQALMDNPSMAPKHETFRYRPELVVRESTAPMHPSRFAK